MHEHLRELRCDVPEYARSAASGGVLAGVYDGICCLPGHCQVGPTTVHIVDREVSFQSDSGEAVAFKIGVGPLRREPAGCWACDYSIEGPHAFAASAFGEDAMQALVMALHALQAHLSAPPLRGRVSWLGAPAADILALPAL